MAHPVKRGELFPDDLKTLLNLATNPLAVCRWMFYCIFIEIHSDKNMETIGSFLVRLNTRSNGLGKRL
jgi:hypothetical protein